MSGHNVLVKSDLACGLHLQSLVFATQDPPMLIGLTPISFKTTQRLHIMTRPALHLPQHTFWLFVKIFINMDIGVVITS